MKYDGYDHTLYLDRSPSMRREWIEIIAVTVGIAFLQRSPSMRREWIEILIHDYFFAKTLESPSMRREWIEIPCFVPPSWF